MCVSVIVISSELKSSWLPFQSGLLYSGGLFNLLLSLCMLHVCVRVVCVRACVYKPVLVTHPELKRVFIGISVSDQIRYGAHGVCTVPPL